jgi:hypothetical protein
MQGLRARVSFKGSALRSALPLIVLFLSFSFAKVGDVRAQTDNSAHWAHWNSKYIEVDFQELLEYEYLCADSEMHTSELPNYARKAKYRFPGVFLGNIRPVDAGVVPVMDQCFKLFGPMNVKADTLTSTEVLIKIGADTVWMPIQNLIINDFMNEVKPGGEALLYCLFLLNGSLGKLRTVFLISEFQALTEE